MVKLTKFQIFMEYLAWKLLVISTRFWARRGLDQFDMFKFRTEYGMVYVNIGRRTEYPGAFDLIDPKGHWIGFPGKVEDDETPLVVK